MRDKYFDTLVCAAAKVRSLTEPKPKLNFWIAKTDKPMRIRLMPPGVCNYCDENRDSSMFPSHSASPNCESGKRNHCSCDLCF